MSKDGQVWVSDSKRPEIEFYSYEAFLETRYAKAQEVTSSYPPRSSCSLTRTRSRVMEGRI